MEPCAGRGRGCNADGAQMTFNVVNTTGWKFEQLGRYTPQITEAMHRLCGKFPDDMTPTSLVQEIAAGVQQLWLVLDDKDEFVAFCLTQVSNVDATGKKVVTLTNMAGDLGLDCADDMCRVIEQWAWDQGAHMTAAIGSRAWGRRLKSQGYDEFAVIFRKPRPDTIGDKT